MEIIYNKSCGSEEFNNSVYLKSSPQKRKNGNILKALTMKREHYSRTSVGIISSAWSNQPKRKGKFTGLTNTKNIQKILSCPKRHLMKQGRFKLRLKIG